MATITKQLLSGSTQGTGIKLTDTSTSNNTDAGYLIHTAVAGTTDIDEVWVWACNTNTAAVILTVEFGGVDVDDNIKVAINPNETVLVVPGLPIHNGLHIKGFASVADKVNVFGFVNRMDY
jgi:hypothetical protein